MTLNIYNVRVGLATNSSSSHSLIIAPKKVGDDQVGEYYGWNAFTLASVEARRDYLHVILYENLKELVGQEIALLVANGMTINHYDADDCEERGIDHQSHITLPCDHTGHLNMEFAREFADYLLQRDFVILGGNDNDGSHPMGTGQALLPWPLQESNSKDWVARKDREHGYWSIFNKHTGAKVRFSFPKNALLDPNMKPEKAYAPELVDIKITDMCPHVNAPCYQFCYQASNPAGQHAPYGKLESLMRALAELGVFEVAIGGGEPTFHPQFAAILRLTRRYGIVPNFTTRSFHWLENDSLRATILPHLGAFAFSVSSAKDVRKLGTLCEVHGINNRGKHKVSIQVVMGTISDHDLKELLKEARHWNFYATLLGFKQTGRGGEYKIPTYIAQSKNWPKQLLELRDKAECPSLCVDTAFVTQYESQIKEAGIPDYLFHKEEGKFSAYVDAVAMKMGPSSFCDAGDMRTLDVSGYGWKREGETESEVARNILNIYRGF